MANYMERLGHGLNRLYSNASSGRGPNDIPLRTLCLYSLAGDRVMRLMRPERIPSLLKYGRLAQIAGLGGTEFLIQCSFSEIPIATAACVGIGGGLMEIGNMIRESLRSTNPSDVLRRENLYRQRTQTLKRKTSSVEPSLF